MIPSFWAKRRVFITGHTGFKGSWLSLWLQHLGANVTGYALPPKTNPAIFSAAKVADKMNSIIGDIRDLDLLTKSLKEHQPEIVIHMAAQPIVRYSYQEPVETYAVNVMGTVNLLEAVRQLSRSGGNVRAVVNVTTDKCYANREWIWGYREKDRLGGHDPYSNSKACSELVTEAYRLSFFQKDSPVAIATARAGNVIGGGDWAQDRLIPDMVRSFSAGETVHIRNPNSTRPWQHVLDPLHGYLTLAEALYNKGQEMAGPWNFGPNEDHAKPVSWLVDFVSKKWGTGATWRLDDGPHPHETTFLKLDSTKARSLLGWRPHLDIATSLEWTIDWYRTFYQNEKEIRNFTINQITKFEHR